MSRPPNHPMNTSTIDQSRVELLQARKNTTAHLHRMERVLLDDTRLDLIATDDLTARPVELCSEFLMDLGTRRVEAYVVREMGNILATDTDGMIARALGSVGLPAKNVGYVCTIRFERGAVACSTAA